MVDIIELLPRSIHDLKTEANLKVIWPWFGSSLRYRGDVAEIGCFRGTMSIKFAFVIKALKQDKTVYAFDTFSGFEIDDTERFGARRRGDYNAPEAFEELTRWSKLLPIMPVRGDAAVTCNTKLLLSMRTPLSFIWLDLDIADLIDPILRTLLPFLDRNTTIGLDDYGRPDCPTVKPWADSVERAGLWQKRYETPTDAYIAFFQKI